MHASEVTPAVMERANALYWESDKSVNQIADELELSKGALYGIIEPRPSGLGCPLCGDEVVYSNRTAEERDMLDCPTCDWDGGPDETVPYQELADGSGQEGAGVGSFAAAEATSEDVAGPSGADPRRDARRRVPPRRVPGASFNTVAGGALLGAAVGLALVMWAKRR
ncbi:MAG: hypothetical protein R3304_00415 [Longimicrobiales bacterium]|nr:hypothetical protein [Longimicrobiales bacterium]